MKSLGSAGVVAATVLFFATSSAVASAPSNFKEHSDLVFALAFSKDGHWLASGGADRVVRLWRARDGQLEGALPRGDHPVSALAFHPTGKLLAIGDQGLRVRVVSIPDGVERLNLPLADAVADVAFNSSGTLLAVGGQAGTGAVFGVDDGKLRFEVRARSVGFSKDGQLLVTAARRGSILQYDTSTGARTTEVATTPFAPALAIPALPKRVFGWFPSDSEIRVWNLVDQSVEFMLRGHQKGILSLQTTADGLWLVSSSLDGTVRLWDVAARVAKKQFSAKRLAFAAISADGSMLAYSEGNEVNIWEVEHE